MNPRESKLLALLMEELQNEMEYSEDDIMDRLGKKPKVEAIAIEGELPVGKVAEEENLDEEDDALMRLEQMRNKGY